VADLPVLSYTMSLDQNDDNSRLVATNAELKRLRRRWSTVFAISLGFCLFGTVAWLALVIRSFTATASQGPWFYHAGNLFVLIFLISALGLLLKGIAAWLRRLRDN